MKQRILSPLPLVIAGMILSEQTNATILNTLHGVRHSFLLPPPLLVPGSHTSFTSSLFRPFWFASFSFCFGPPCPLSWALFAPVGTYHWLLLSGLSLFFLLFTWVFRTTGASVHRRGRCIGVFFSQVYVVSLVLSVLVCLSVDVTGALVLP